MQRVRMHAALAAVMLAAALLGTRVQADLSAAVKADLATSKYVYIATTRKDGSFGKPAEIWFLYHNGAVYVASPPTAWRVRRIKAGRAQAKIAVGKPDGPSFMATGALVNEPDVYPTLFDTYAKKYPDGWPKFEEKFRSGLKDGSRVLIKFTPKDS
ncbi:MAG TPA: hypothetical protein VF515_16250 [Candidatus Binatia bacterium]